MSLKLAFIIDPLDHLKPAKDSSIAMMRAAARQGHAVFAIDAAQLRWRHPADSAPAGVAGLATALTLTDSNSPWYHAGQSEWTPLKDFDAVLMRKDPPFDFEYITATWLLERAEQEGARIVNRPRALRDHSEKLAITEFPHLTVPSLIGRDADEINAFIDREGDTILKPLDGMGGSQIFRIRRDDPNRNAILETVSESGARTVMIQRYIPEISAGDKRVLLIDGRPFPYCLARIPKAGETRGNLAAGGTGVARPLTARDREIAEYLGPFLVARGLTLVGLDVIGDYLTEINVTSPTCMVEIAAQTGESPAEAMIAAVERLCAAG